MADRVRIVSTLLAGSLVLTSACTLEPRYERPEAPVSSAWPAASAPSGPEASTPASDVGWRTFFGDPALQRLIAIALENNRDVRVAAINIAAARAQYRIQRADLFPAIGVVADESVSRIPTSVLAANAGGLSAGTGTGPSGDHVILRDYSVGIGFTAYELDFFGRIRSLSRARLEQYEGLVETRRSAVITLVSEVANAYLSILADADLLRVTRQTLESQQASYDLVKTGFDQGVQTQLALRQAQTSVESARVQLAVYTRQIAQDRNALTLLLGAPIPDDVTFASGLDTQTLIEDLPAGLPSDLLARRPDVLAAEHDLKGANANIGAARAAFFPSVSLTGNFGTMSTQLGGLFEGGSRTWSFMPQISIPIFAGGANVAGLDLAKQRKNLQIATYEKTVQTAFREVSDALVARSSLRDQLDAQSALESATHDAYDLSNLRFESGVDSYLTVLDSQRAWFGAQQGLVTVKLSRLQSLVTLYKVLGGGWRETSEVAGAPQNP